MPVLIQEIKQLLTELNASKAAGPDKLPPDLLKASMDSWAPLLAHLFTIIDSTSMIPKSLTQSIIALIYK